MAINCPDCGTQLWLYVGESPSDGMLAVVAKIRCDECAGMRRSYESAEAVARKALRNAEALAERIKQLTKNGEDNLVPTQKEDLWKTTETMQSNLNVYRNKLEKLRLIAAKFKTRTGMRIK